MPVLVPSTPTCRPVPKTPGPLPALMARNAAGPVWVFGVDADRTDAFARNTWTTIALAPNAGKAFVALALPENAVALADSEHANPVVRRLKALNGGHRWVA